VQAPLPEVGSVAEVTADRLAYGGDAVARVGGLAVFIPFAAPGDRLRVKITEVKKNYARAVILKVLEPSQSRREPRCHYFGECGGCQLQHITYEAQLQAKTSFVRDALTRIGKIDWNEEIPIRHDREFGYRARARIKIEAPGASAGSPTKIGFNRAASRNVCDIESCPVLAPELNDALASLRSRLGNETTGTVSRLGAWSTEVTLAAGEAGVVELMDSSSTEIVTQRVAGTRYRFTPSSFFQVNPFLLEALVQEAVAGHAGETAIDLYCGVGLFTLQLARSFRSVNGVEWNADSCDLARENASAAGIKNVQFDTNRVDDWIDVAVKRKSLPELVLLDPPRTGAAKSIPGIAALQPRVIVYVSCDPTTLARDARALIDSGYRLSRVTALDLFPQTHHVETVAVLERGER
jgi:23S rRNA (uracil1939-C5)-methyltransferase